MNFSSYEVGKPYIAGRTDWLEVAEYNYRSNAHELRIFFKNLQSFEVEQFKKGKPEFKLVVQGQILFLLFKIGSMAWSDAPFSWHLVPESERTIPPILKPTESALLQVILVDAVTGIIKGLRTIGLNHEFSVALHDAIHIQADQTFSVPDYDAELSRIYRQYPTSMKLGRIAIASHN